MSMQLDHLVIAARDLAQGVAWLEARVGVPMGAGGRHELMGTHNRLLALGPGRFIEVIAVDPEAPPPGCARWFELDSPAMQERLGAGPALVAWVARSDDIEGTIAAVAEGRPRILALARGEFRWRIGVPASGALALGGISPTLIQWSTRHPADVLGDSGCRLEKLVLRDRAAPAELERLRRAGLDPADPIVARADGAAGLEAHLRTPRGIVVL
jgi:hypothetical protein